MRIAHRATAIAVALSFVGCTAVIGDGEGSVTGDRGGSDSGAASDDAGGSDAAASEDTISTSDTSASSADTSTASGDTGVARPDTGSPDTGSPDTGSPDTGGGMPPDAGGDPIDAARVVCVDEINKYRATMSLPPFAPWTSAESCADGQSKNDSMTMVAHSAFGKCGESAQNECPGWPGPPDTLIKGCLKMMWAEGPGMPFSAHGHYINMSSTAYSSVSCGFYQTPSGSWWAIQDFK